MCLCRRSWYRGWPTVVGLCLCRRSWYRGWLTVVGLCLCRRSWYRGWSTVVGLCVCVQEELVQRLVDCSGTMSVCVCVGGAGTEAGQLGAVGALTPQRVCHRPADGSHGGAEHRCELQGDQQHVGQSASPPHRCWLSGPPQTSTVRLLSACRLCQILKLSEFYNSFNDLPTKRVDFSSEITRFVGKYK